MGRRCRRPLLGHCPSGQTGCRVHRRRTMTDRSVARTVGQSSCGSGHHPAGTHQCHRATSAGSGMMLTVKLRLMAVFDSQHGGFATGWSPVSWGSINELFVNLTIPSGHPTQNHRGVLGVTPVLAAKWPETVTAKGSVSNCVQNRLRETSGHGVIGRPRRRRALPSSFRAISLRYQRRIVSGVTMPAPCARIRRPSFWPRTASRRRWASVRRSGRGPRCLPEDPILLSEIIDHVFLVAVHPARGP